MKTEDLISALAADTVPQQSVARQLGRANPVGVVLSVVAFAVFWGPRPDIWAALGSAAALKTIVPLILALLAGLFAVALVHPGSPRRRHGAILGIAATLIGGTFFLAVMRDGGTGLVAALATPSLIVCLVSIPILAMPVLIAGFWGLASGAALRPAMTGAVAGMMSGGLAASVYSVYCDQDAVLFVLPAYSVAIMSVALLGALVGPRLLRW